MATACCTGALAARASARVVSATAAHRAPAPECRKPLRHTPLQPRLTVLAPSRMLRRRGHCDSMPLSQRAKDTGARAAGAAEAVPPVDDQNKEPAKDTIGTYLTLMRDNFCRVSLGDAGATSCTSDALWGGLGVTLAFLLLGMIDMYISPSGLPFMIGSYGTISILLFGAPNAPVLHTWNVVVGHIVAAFIALVYFQLQLPVWIARALGMGTLVTFMLLTGSVHPPGGALILTFMDSAKMQSLSWWFMLYPGLLGLLVIFPIAALTNYMKENFKFMVQTPK